MDTKNYKIGEKCAILGITSNIALFILKLFAGTVGRSQAMIADAFHTGSDALTSLAVLLGFKIAQKPADKHHPFGHGRAESIAAKIVSIVILYAGLRIAYDSAKVLISGNVSEPGTIAFAAVVISIIVKEFTYRQVIRVGIKIKSTSLKADAYHHRSDVLSSVAALIGIVGAKMGNAFMDPLAGIIVAAFIIKTGADTFHAAYDELMDAAPPQTLYDDIKKTTASVQGVDKIKKIMIRKTGLEFFVEIIIGVDALKTVKAGHDVTIKITKALLREFPNIKDVIVHVEPV
ncbi:MAG: cation diffusion facilitator family transporter [Candidatus Omnitrophota bacterium]